MDIEEEKKWYREMLIESAKEDGLEQGIEQGIEKNKTETVINMMKEKLDFKLISRITVLSLENIKSISKTINY